MSRRVLVIEDELEILRLVELHLQDLGCEVTAAEGGARGLELALAGPWDLLILDLMLPDVDGLEICRRVRAAGQSGAYTPVLMLTAKSSELDRVLGLETGADDYITKPFSVRELIARVKAIFRRIEALSSQEKNEQAVLRFSDLTIDVGRRRVEVAGSLTGLTAKEFDLLLHFARHPGRVFTRAELLDRVWGYGQGGYEHTVNSHINRLRAKIEHDPASPRFVLTVWGVGYRFAELSELTPTPVLAAPAEAVR